MLLATWPDSIHIGLQDILWPISLLPSSLPSKKAKSEIFEENDNHYFYSPSFMHFSIISCRTWLNVLLLTFSSRHITKNDHRGISEKTFSKTHPSQADYKHQFYLKRSIADFVDGFFHSVGSFTFYERK